MPRVLAALFLMLAFLGIPLLTTAQISCQKQFVISEVILPTTTQLTPGELAATRTRLIGRCFDDGKVRELSDRVRDALQSFGYFRASVSEPSVTVVDFSRRPQPVSLNIEFAEGARYKVREIIWSGIEAVSTDQIVSVSQIHPEDILDTSKVRDLLEAVRRLYIAIGYPNVTIAPEVQVHEAGHWVSLNFSVLEGAQTP
jgi:outer membrane protein assembly factor BamA